MPGLVHVSSVRFSKQGADPLGPITFSRMTPYVGYASDPAARQRSYRLTMGLLRFELAYPDSDKWSFGVKTCKDAAYEGGRPINIYTVLQPSGPSDEAYITTWARQTACVLSHASSLTALANCPRYLPRQGHAGACDIAYVNNGTVDPSARPGVPIASIDDEFEYYFADPGDPESLRFPGAHRHAVGRMAMSWDAQREAWVDAVGVVAAEESGHFKSAIVRSADRLLVAGLPFDASLDGLNPALVFSGRLRDADACLFNVDHGSFVDVSEMLPVGASVQGYSHLAAPMVGNIGEIVAALIAAMPLRNPGAYANLQQGDRRRAVLHTLLCDSLATELVAHLSSNHTLSHYLLRFNREAPRHDMPADASVRTCYQERDQVGPVYADLLRASDPVQVDCDVRVDNAWIESACRSSPDLAPCLLLADGIEEITLVVSCWVGRSQA